ncbi:MAG TPA: hypothetical protein VFR44_10910, partial [Actinomycetota bacterium]|nr:hypothetical protein [Actinomycetota bacterium]
MDRRTRESKLIRKSGLGMREADAEQAIVEYRRADRCRICGVGVSDRMNAKTVRITIDEALMSGATYKAALAAVEPFVAEWPPEERPTYAAIRNHAKRHLNSDEALIRALMEAHAIGAGVDVEDGAGSIVTPGGIFALVAQKGYEQLRDGDAVPTVGETIQASRALTAMEVDQLRYELKRERLMVRSLVTLVKEVAPGALESVTTS